MLTCVFLSTLRWFILYRFCSIWYKGWSILYRFCSILYKECSILYRFCRIFWMFYSILLMCIPFFGLFWSIWYKKCFILYTECSILDQGSSIWYIIYFVIYTICSRVYMFFYIYVLVSGDGVINRNNQGKLCNVFGEKISINGKFIYNIWRYFV
jgi:fatty acid desaturase